MILPPQRVRLGKGAGAVVPLRESHLFEPLLAVQLVVPAQRRERDVTTKNGIGILQGHSHGFLGPTNFANGPTKVAEIISIFLYFGLFCPKIPKIQPNYF